MAAGGDEVPGGAVDHDLGVVAAAADLNVVPVAVMAPLTTIPSLPPLPYSCRTTVVAPMFIAAPTSTEMSPH